MKLTTFALSEFENRNGVSSWRVSGLLAGVRIRKNFKSKAEAATAKATLDIQALQAAAGGLRSAATFLTEGQLRDAEAAFRRLPKDGPSLAFLLDLALTTYRPPEREQTLDAAVADYLAAKGRERDRGIISSAQVGSIRKELARLTARFPGQTVSQLGVPDLTTFCERGLPSLKTQNNRRGILSTFFKFALQKDWIAKNPVAKVPHHRIAHRRGSARTLTPTQAQNLMTHVEGYRGGALVPFFALCLFAGIRPCLRAGEIFKLRPANIRLETGVIHVEPETSKVRMKRSIAIQPNLAAWLRAYPLDRFPIIIPNLQHERKEIATKFELTHDIMRHTFISMHVAKFRSMGEAALQAGNSESIIRKHYLDLKTPAEAEEFFSIMPAGHVKVATGQTLPFPAHGAALAAVG
jgi:integrase